MGYIEVKAVKEYVLHIRDDAEMEKFMAMVKNVNAPTPELAKYREELLRSCEDKMKQALPD